MKLNTNKKFILVCLTLLQNALHANLNEYGISDIVVPEKISTSEKNEITKARIKEELGENFTLEDILNLLPQIQALYDHLLNTQNDKPQTWQILKNALYDMKKAKMRPYLKPTQVTADDEHLLRVELGKLSREIEQVG